MKAHELFVIEYKRRNTSYEYFKSWFNSRMLFSEFNLRQLFYAESRTAWCVVGDCSEIDTLKCKSCNEVIKCE